MPHVPVCLKSAVRRSARLAALAIAALLAAGARAEEVHTHLTGKVLTVTPLTTDVADALAAHGVKVGASVDIDYSIDSTATGEITTPPYATYFDGVLSASVSIGSYEAHMGDTLQPNLVQVGDDVPLDFQADSYDALSSGTDTDKILQGTEPLFTVLIDLIFSDGDGTTLSDDGIVQDVKDFQLGFGSVGGAHGSVFFSIELGPGGGGGGGGGDSTALARKGQLQAGSKFGGALLETHAKFAAAPPEKDPFGAQEDKLVDKAHDTFVAQFVKAVNKALKKGGSAPLPADEKETAAASVQDGCDALVGSLLAGADPQSKSDRALRGKLLRAAGAQCAADLAAHAKDVLKPKPDKLAAKLAKSRSKLAAAFDKALDKAAKQGVAYAGPGADEVSDAVTVLVDAYVQLTADGV